MLYDNILTDGITNKGHIEELHYCLIFKYTFKTEIIRLLPNEIILQIHII